MKRLHVCFVSILIISLLFSSSAFTPVDVRAQVSASFTCPPYDPNVSGSMRQSDCQALIQFYNDTGGPNWVTQTDWLTSAPACTWYGVYCTTWGPYGYIWLLSLANNNLTGPITSIGSMQMVANIEFRHNHLNGHIDFLCSHEFHRISLGYNNLDGQIPSCLGSQTQVSLLDLNSNNFSGLIPPELSQMTSLRLLWIEQNSLEGSIPTQFNNLPNIEQIELGFNKLSGQLPAFLGNITKLTYLTLNDNNFQGMIPPEYGNLINLIGLSLQNNDLEGIIPPQLGSMISLTGFGVSNNPKLYGALPKSFLNLKKLVYFSIGSTNVCIPSGQGFQDWLTTITNKNGTENICQIPVVLVHGYNDTAQSWDTYIHSLLPSINITQAYAVELDTGYGDHIANTIFQNAQTLGNFIEQVKKETGQDQVNIIAHSMGGLIARAYINFDMDAQNPDVYQLIMLGTPNGGSNSARLLELAHYHIGVNSLLRQPYIVVGTHELTPEYLDWFNSKVTDRKGVPFYALAGNYGGGLTCIPSPFEGLPNDIVVWRGSVFAISLDGEMTYPVTHSCKGHHSRMRDVGQDAGGQEIFDSFVKPLLQNQPIPSEVQPTNSAMMQNTDQSLTTVQFTDTQAGTLYPAVHLEFPLILGEVVTQTTFTVMGNPNQMTVSLRDPMGSIITPSTSDPQVQYMQMNDFMLMTGYTISNPITGTWTIIVDANGQTPAEGTGIVVLNAIKSDLQLIVPVNGEEFSVNEPITITAQLLQQDIPVTGANITATLTIPDNTISDIQLMDDGNHGDGAPNDGLYGYVLTPIQSGTYSAIVKATGSYNGNDFNRWSVWLLGTTNEETFLYLPLIIRQ